MKWKYREKAVNHLAMMLWRMRKSQILYMTTWGVGDGGAASTGDRVVALLANLHKATAPSSCCLGL